MSELSPGPGKIAVPATAVRVARRTIVPEAQRSPSPNGAPSPPFACVMPWKNSAAESGRPVAVRRTVSAEICTLPDACNRPPLPSDVMQPVPDPDGALLPHGQAEPEPSPEHQVTPTCPLSHRKRG